MALQVPKLPRQEEPVPEAEMTFTWETLIHGDTTGEWLERMPCPGGWIVRTTQYDDGAPTVNICYVPDPEHAWTDERNPA